MSEAKFWTCEKGVRTKPLPILIAKGDQLYQAPFGAAAGKPIAEIRGNCVYRMYTGLAIPVATVRGDNVTQGFGSRPWISISGNGAYDTIGAKALVFLQGVNCTKMQLAMAAAIYKTENRP